MSFQFSQTNPDAINAYLASSPNVHEILMRIAQVFMSDFKLDTARVKHVRYQGGDEALVVEVWVPGSTIEVLEKQTRFDEVWEERNFPPYHGVVVIFHARDGMAHAERLREQREAHRRRVLEQKIAAVAPLGSTVTELTHHALVEALLPNIYLLGEEASS